MAYSSKGNKFSKPVIKKSLIYAEDDIYCAKTENGFYLFHTTMDPAEKFKQRRIANLSDKPGPEFIVERMRYGMNQEKIKWLLNKDACKEWIEDNYDFIFSSDPSPWAPIKIGEKRAKRVTGTGSDDDDDTPTRPKKQQKQDSDSDDDKPKVTFTDISKKLDDYFIILMEIRNHIKQTPTDCVPNGE